MLRLASQIVARAILNFERTSASQARAIGFSKFSIQRFPISYGILSTTEVQPKRLYSGKVGNFTINVVKVSKYFHVEI